MGLISAIIEAFKPASNSRNLSLEEQIALNQLTAPMTDIPTTPMVPPGTFDPAMRTLENIGTVWGPVEAGLNQLTGMIAASGTGLAKGVNAAIGTTPQEMPWMAEARPWEQPETGTVPPLTDEQIEQAFSNLVYQPYSRQGAELVQAAGVPFEALHRAGEATADIAREEAGMPPWLATAFGTAVEAAPILIPALKGAGGGKVLGSEAGAIRAIEPGFKVKYPYEYYSPRDVGRLKIPWGDLEREVRSVSYGLKTMDEAAIQQAAKKMKRYVREDAVLVPVPDSKGSTQANLALANEISRLTGAKVQDVLTRSAPTESQMMRAKSGKTRLSPEELNIVAKEGVNDPKKVLFVDNVVSSGNTLKAARDAIGGGNGLTYSNAIVHPDIKHMVVREPIEKYQTTPGTVERRTGPPTPMEREFPPDRPVSDRWWEVLPALPERYDPIGKGVTEVTKLIPITAKEGESLQGVYVKSPQGPTRAAFQIGGPETRGYEDWYLLDLPVEKSKSYGAKGEWGYAASKKQLELLDSIREDLPNRVAGERPGYPEQRMGTPGKEFETPEATQLAAEPGLIQEAAVEYKGRQKLEPNYEVPKYYKGKQIPEVPAPKFHAEEIGGTQRILKPFGDVELSTEAKQFMGWLDRNRNKIAISTNDKTGISWDFCTTCPAKLKAKGACPYCYVSHARIMNINARGLVDVPYRHELLYMPQDLVKTINENMGGQRLFSFGDFRPGIDDANVAALLKDAEQRGAIIKGITKQKEMVERFADHPNMRLNISTDLLPRSMSNAPTIDQALEWKAGRSNVAIRTVALNTKQALELAPDPRVDVVTFYKGPTGQKLMNIIKRQNPELIKKVGYERIRREVSTWENMSTKYGFGEEMVKKYPEKICCGGGKCVHDKAKCGFAVGALILGLHVPEWFEDEEPGL